MQERKLSTATAVSILALFFSLTGTAIAAHHYLITSTTQIKPSVLKSLKGNRGPEGPAGSAGPMGPAGPPGPPGQSNLSAITTVIGPTVEVPNGKVEAALAACPPGSHAISGGGSAGIAGIDVSEMESNRQEWFIITVNETGITIKIHAEVQCAAAGQAIAASVRRPVHTGSKPRHLIAQITSELQARRR